MKVAAVVALALAAVPALAHAGDELPGRVVFARGSSLWLTDARGKGKAAELAALPGPATDVRAIRSDSDGDTLLVDHGGRWYVGSVPATGGTTTLTPLPCAAGPARLSPTGVHVLCADPGAPGKAMIVRLRDGKTFARDAAIAGATIVEKGGVRELVSLEGGQVIAALLRDQRQKRVVSPVAPARGFLASPDGTRAAGVYQVTPAQPKGAPPRDELMAFPLDGSGARRRLIRDGVVLDWSWNGQWLLVQDGGKACIARGLGGQYKCWKGFTAVSLAPDGAYALLLGPRSKDAPVDATPPPTDPGEGADEGEAEVEDTAVPLPRGPLSLYRARLAGAFTETPALVETVIDGAALWLPDPPSVASSTATP